MKKRETVALFKSLLLSLLSEKILRATLLAHESPLATCRCETRQILYCPLTCQFEGGTASTCMARREPERCVCVCVCVCVCARARAYAALKDVE